MLHLLRNGGLTTGGFNFDAKVRRQSIDVDDMLCAHIGGLDALAKGLVSAAAIIEKGDVDQFLRERYSGWDGDLGRAICETATLETLAQRTLDDGIDPVPASGRQEMLETLVQRHL
jgi:xylose isomerase